MRKKIIIALALLMLLVSFAHAKVDLPVQTTDPLIRSLEIVYPKIEIYRENQPFTMSFDILNSTYSRLTNATTSCIYVINNNLGEIVNSGYLKYNTTNQYWYFEQTGLSSLDYHFNYYIHCTNTETNIKGFLSSSFEITETGNIRQTDFSVVSIIILLPMICGLFLLFGAFALNPEEHPVLRIFLILLSFTTYLISSWFGVITLIKYYNFETLENSTVTSVYILGIMFVLILFYFLIYAFYKATHAAAQQKKEMMLQ